MKNSSGENKVVFPLLDIGSSRVVFSDDRRIDICGVRVDSVTMPEAIQRIDELVAGREPSYVVTPNVDHIVRLQNDPEFKQAYEGAALVLPDGVPLLWAGHFLGRAFKEKVSGSDLVVAECARLAENGHRLFLLGGRPGAAEKARETLLRKHPGLKIVGVYSPPYGFEADAAENASIVERIHRAAPDILLVGLGAPKQEKWIHRYYRQTGVPVSIGVGVTFEFIGGVVRRAPLTMQRLGLEWLWRLAHEPRRLWRRYLVDDPQFFILLLKQRLSGRRSLG